MCAMTANAEVLIQLPRKDIDRLHRLQVFADRLNDDPAAYRVDPRQADALGSLVRQFDEQFQLAASPSGRTTRVIEAKDAARDAAVGLYREIAGQIKADPTIAMADKIALGFKPARPRRAPGGIEPPDTAPLLAILEAGDGFHRMTYADERSPARRGRPDGVARLDLRVAVAERPIIDPDQATIHLSITRSPFVVEHDRLLAGRLATYHGRWSTAAGKPGPWSLPVTMTIVAKG